MSWLFNGPKVPKLTPQAKSPPHDSGLFDNAAARQWFLEDVYNVIQQQKLQANKPANLSPIGKIYIRLDWHGLPQGNITNLYHHKTGDTYHIIVCTKTGVVVLDDDASLFPSDTLVTKLRLLGG